MRKLFVLIFTICFLSGIVLNAFAGHRDAEISGRVAKRIKPYKATDEAKIDAECSREKLAIEKEPQGYELNVENIGAGKAPDQEEFGVYSK